MGTKHPDFPVNRAIYSFSGTVTRLRRKATPDLYRARDAAKGNSPESSHVNIREAGFI